MYVPHVGAFVQRDPLPQGIPILGYSDSAVSELRARMNKHEASNLYAYAMENSINSRDPTGLLCLASCERQKLLCRIACNSIYFACSDQGYALGLGAGFEIACLFARELCGADCEAAYYSCKLIEFLWASIDVALLVVGAVLVIGGIAYTVVTLPAAAGGGLGLATSAAGVLIISAVLSSDDESGRCCVA